MTKRLTLTICALATAVGAAAPALAHHSFAMFDRQKRVVLVGTVVKYDWANPHSHLTVQVAPDPANPQLAGTWDLEATAPNIMIRQGWTRTSFQPGDKITAVGYALKDGTKGAQLSYAMGADGKRLYMDVARPADPAPAAPPAGKP